LIPSQGHIVIKPIVRYMILCEDWEADPASPRKVNILGLLSNIVSYEDPPYPLLYRQFSVFLALTGCRGSGRGQILAVFEETGQVIFKTSLREIQLGSDPLDVVGVAFRIRDCLFPNAGMYSIQFWYNGELVDERPMRLR